MALKNRHLLKLRGRGLVPLLGQPHLGLKLINPGREPRDLVELWAGLPDGLFSSLKSLFG
jgi:hypothetical protein